MTAYDCGPAWCEHMLAYCTNLLSQLGDLHASELKDGSDGFVDYPVTTGPADDPDRYGVRELLKEIQRHRPFY